MPETTGRSAFALTSPPPVNTVHYDRVWWVVTGINANGLQCSLDGRPFAPVASPRVAPRCRPTYSGLAPGPPTFRARAWDWAGNVDPTLVTRTWTVLP